MLIISIFIFVSASIILGTIYFTNRRKETLHFQKIASLEHSLQKHKREIAERDKNLNRYDFLKYNLTEALVIQEKIILP